MAAPPSMSAAMARGTALLGAGGARSDVTQSMAGAERMMKKAAEEASQRTESAAAKHLQVRVPPMGGWCPMEGMTEG